MFIDSDPPLSLPGTLPTGPSRSPSPPLPPTEPHNQSNGLFTDIFDTSDSDHNNPNSASPASTFPNDPSTDLPTQQFEQWFLTESIPSDIPRLRATHTTAGYRDGIASAKEEHLQEGFDEGYGLGAVMGLRIGYLVGVIEGVVKGLRTHRAKREETERRDRLAGKVSRGPDAVTTPVEVIEPVADPGTSEAGGLREVEDAEVLFVQAKAELDISKVFGKDHWDEKGIWTYQVDGDDDGNTSEVDFRDVVSSHPLVRKWDGIAESLMKKYGLSREVWEGEEWEKGRIDDEVG
ncbi:Essential protein Yae1, N terminal [Agyrium rufum]|nr:Essential protein Yae1, N terminal [Agyrium rufum]